MMSGAGKETGVSLLTDEVWDSSYGQCVIPHPVHAWRKDQVAGVAYSATV